MIILLVEVGNKNEVKKLVKNIVIKTDNGDKTVELRNLKGRERKKGFKLYTAIAKKDQEDLDALNKYLEYLDELGMDIAGMKLEEWDELDTPEQDKIIKTIQEQIQGKIDFLKSSSKSESSEQKESPA